jgi:hypothetical protein
VLKWRLNSLTKEAPQQVSISQHEFSQLYNEWLKRKDISIDNMNYCNLKCQMANGANANCLNDLRAQTHAMLDKLQV